MKIETRFALGDKLWVLMGTTPWEIEVAAIIYGKGGVRYLDRRTNTAFYETQCFPTEETAKKIVFTN